MLAMSIVAPSGSLRRHDIDWLRIIALGLLVVYHVLCVFNSSGWEIKSAHAGPWADGVIALLTPWRMTLVFVIGGIAARFLFEKLDAMALARNRAQRLILPFIFGVIFLAPPQTYIRLSAAGAEHGSFLDFWLHRFWFANQIHGVHFPDFVHLWFLPYLFTYAVLVACIWKWRPVLFARASHWADAAPVWLLLALVMAWMVFVGNYVEPWKHRTMVFFYDLSGHLKYGPAFLFGVLIARGNLFWRRVAAARWWLLALAAALGTASYAAWLITHGKLEMLWLRELYGAVTVFAALAFGVVFLNRPSAALTYCNDAVLPVYVLHQTLLVLIASVSGAMLWPVEAALPFLLISTLATSIALYHFLIRHTSWLRALFGQSPHARKPWPPAEVRAGA